MTKIVARSRRTGQAALLTSPFLAAVRNLALRCTPMSATVRSLAPVIGHRPGMP